MEMKKALMNIFNFAIMDAGAWFTSLWSGLLGSSALIGGFLLALMQKYLVRDLAFIPWLILIITLDTISGYRLARKRFKEDPLNSPEPTRQTLREKLAGKATAVTISLILLNILTNFEINGLPAQNAFVDIKLFGLEFDLNVFKIIYFTGAVYMIFAEAKSTIRNLRALGYNLFPKKIDEIINKVTGDNE